MLNGCCCGEDSSLYETYNFYSFFVDKNDTIYIKSKYNFDEDNQTFYMAQDRESHRWSEVNVTHNTEEEIKIIQNRIVIKDSHGEISHKTTLPTIEEIASATDRELLDAKISYIPFKSPYQNSWDRKRVIASVLTNRFLYNRQNERYLYHTIYNFYLLREESSWEITYINKESSENGYSYFDEYSDILTPPYNSHELNYDILNRWVLSTDTKASICYNSYNNENTEWSELKCFVQDEDRIIVKKLFGDIYPQAYSDTLQKYMDKYKSSAPLLYFFDKNSNMHLFYNDTSNAKGKYFNYVMFSKDKPTNPKYEQKIERR